jgi:hypothetical protein
MLCQVEPAAGPRAVIDMGIARIEDVPRARNQPMTAFRDRDWLVWITHGGNDMWTLVTDQLVQRGAIAAFGIAFEDCLEALEAQMPTLRTSLGVR